MGTRTIMLLKTLLNKSEESVIMIQQSCKATSHKITNVPVKMIREITIPTVVVQTTNLLTKILLRCNNNIITNTSSISSLKKCNKAVHRCNRILILDMATAVSNKIRTSLTTVAFTNEISFNSSISSKATKILIGRFKT